MAKADYIAPNDDAFNAQLQTFKNGIGSYSAVLGLAARVWEQASLGPAAQRAVGRANGRECTWRVSW